MVPLKKCTTSRICTYKNSIFSAPYQQIFNVLQNSITDKTQTLPYQFYVISVKQEPTRYFVKIHSFNVDIKNQVF